MHARLRRTLAVGAALLAAAPFVLTTGNAASAGESDRPANAADFKERILARGEGQARTASGSAAVALPPGGVGNGIVQLYVEPGTPGRGTFTVLTGPNHPAGPGLNVLFGNGVPGTSYLIVRHVNNQTSPATIKDYVQGNLITHATEMSLDDIYSTFDELDNGYDVTWPFLDFGALKLQITVAGTTLADSRVQITSTIKPSTSGDDIQVQYILDTALGGDDGPVLQTQQATTVFRPFDPVVTTERLVTDNHLAVADNDANPIPPNLGIGVSASGPAGIGATAPDSVKYVCWPDAIYAPIGEYEIWDSYDISTPASTCLNSTTRTTRPWCHCGRSTNRPDR